jgi:hypothetical protein
MFKHFCTDNFNTRSTTQTRSKYTCRLNFHFFIYFRRVYLLLVCVSVRVLKLTVQKCLNFHFFIYFRRVYLLLVCVAVRVLKLSVQKCLNVHSKYTRLKYIKKWKFKHFCTVNFNTRTSTQTRSKYTRLKYIKKWMFKHVDSTKMFKLSFFYIF